MNEAVSAYALVAEFTTADALLAASRRARDVGYAKLDAFTPYSVPGLSEALGLRPSRLPWLVFCGAVLGGAGAYFMQWYAATQSYPINVAGRALHSWPSFVPVTFELTVLGGSFAAVLGMLFGSRLTRLDHPVFGVAGFARASTDRFFLCIEAEDAAFDVDAARSFLQTLSPEGVHELAR